MYGDDDHPEQSWDLGNAVEVFSMPTFLPTYHDSSFRIVPKQRNQREFPCRAVLAAYAALKN